ncbi:transglycosylase SCDLUD_004535 [Saccharomycodes ludwigii]|uniref:transglycosylase n=1 Tax=Saccharomycodes ludwigii TaxID=36035 RepID=UPI001E851128|nr:hypothetical protein SCDLUD_004535 [Saccharomycodes ludwigii]KAH3899109.1 hypothetical protein SCDLUD_004535 [Saccharomycodes ludwigii]
MPAPKLFLLPIFLLLSAFFNNVHATSSACNPLSATAACSPNKALATSYVDTFSEQSSFFSNYTSTGEITYSEEDGMKMTMNKRFDNPGLKSNFYIMYGRLEIEFKCANGQGIVSSFYLQSDDLDEIDIEWLGGDSTQFQSNYFSKGNVTTYDRGEFHTVSNPCDTFHTYGIDWDMDKTVWSVDGQTVRTLLNTSNEGYPQSPMAIYIGLWAGGDPTNPSGTIEWAGGETDYTDLPFYMFVKSMTVSDYSTGSTYSYSDQTGNWESIVASDGAVYGRYEEAVEAFNTLVSNSTVSSSSNGTATTSATTSVSASTSDSVPASSSVFTSTSASDSVPASSSVFSFTNSSFTSSSTIINSSTASYIFTSELSYSSLSSSIDSSSSQDSTSVPTTTTLTTKPKSSSASSISNSTTKKAVTVSSSNDGYINNLNGALTILFIGILSLL